ncbi:hypothetical protein HYR54_08900 [Candidatus Acetothermia bacterium]|nr:hypothetical protein [Candidatus Acetothermia bacterium]MBI3661402.1 hypothetical protein [Candidatus Acetothermia bacterium]
MIFSKRAWLGGAIICGLLVGTVPMEIQASNSTKQSTADYFLIEFLLGLQGALMGGGAGYYGTYISLSALQPCPPDKPQQACEIEKSFLALIIGTNIGIPTGAALFGVHLAGTVLGVQGGNLLLALVGAWIGSLAGATLGSDWAVQPSDLTLLMNPMTMAALGATIGYNIGTFIPQQTPISSLISLEIPVIRWRF